MYTSPAFVSQETRLPNSVQVSFGVLVEPEPMVDAGAVVASEPEVEVEAVVETEPVVEAEVVVGTEVATRRSATALFLSLVLVHGVL